MYNRQVVYFLFTHVGGNYARTRNDSNARNARRFRIAAEVGETAIEINLPVTLPRNRQPNHYKIVKKDIPEKAKGKTYHGKTVIWINNHGIRLRGNFGVRGGGNKQDPFIEEVDGEQFTYEVIVPGPAPEGSPNLSLFRRDRCPAGRRHNGQRW